MAGHEIGNQVLVHAVLLVQGEILIHKSVVDCVSGLAHPVQHRIGHMLRCDLQLSGDMELHQFLKESILLVCQEIVKANAAADEDFLHAGQLP